MPGWNAEPSIVLGLGALTTLYFVAWARWRERLGGPPDVNRLQVACFSAAIFVLILALVSPIASIGDELLFSIHMLQHLLITLVMPPLLLAGTPGWMIQHLFRPRWVLWVARHLTRPLPAYLTFNTLFAISHVPAVYDVIFSNQALHILEHLLLMATSVLLWWPVLSPVPQLPRLSYPAQMLYVFLQTLGGVAVGSFLSLGSTPLYAKYANSPGMWGMTPLVDQQVGGLMMWVGGGTYFFGALAVIFFIWANRDAADQARERARLKPGTPRPLGSRPG